ncbi:MAG: hypothetical protein QJR12_13445 [Mycobacterium sp.]|uniref:hypothetical protein n=1 Tax=Mycobacterium sp. TaxID=1785 RepID=UPI00260A5945|nr:hypothetical protein [Mycobacterium sp.]MDI3315229.1 hypothetical protein [Mycobacterium sp.]
MKATEKRLLVVVVCGAVATCLVAALVTRNGSSGPLTLAQVLSTAIIPLILLALATRFCAPKRVSESGRPRKHTRTGS